MDESRYELHPGDGLFPTTVLELPDVPQTLFVRGDPEVLSTPALSIIGARKASPYGLAVAELAAKVAVEAGVTVVSGGAVGCDQASGWAAVNAGGKHVVVLGTGPALERGAYRPYARCRRCGRVDLAVGHGAA